VGLMTVRDGLHHAVSGGGGDLVTNHILLPSSQLGMLPRSFRNDNVFESFT
jgi:hypothetical protein